MRYSLFHKGAIRVFMKTPLEKSWSIALTYSSGEQYSLSVARGARRATRRARETSLLNYHLACEVADPRRDFQARAQNARGESLALRRVVPSPKERHRVQARPLEVYVKFLRKRDVVLKDARTECALDRLRKRDVVFKQRTLKVCVRPSPNEYPSCSNSHVQAVR